MSTKKRLAIIAVSVVILIVGVAMAAYPLISDYLTGKETAEVVTAAMAQTEAAAPDDLIIAKEDAQAYNRELATGVVRSDRRPAYEDLVNLSGNGLMGVVEIPRIDVSLPIYHGTDSDVLEKGVGHLLGTSLPVGGESTHAVITGHTGMAGRRMLTDLAQLCIGDTFRLHVLGDTLTYEVDQILVVLPDELDALRIISGEDHVTLVTCTPYGVNSHRLLVRGVRVQTDGVDMDTDTDVAYAPVSPAPSVWRLEYVRSLVGAALGVAVIVVVVMLIPRIHRRRRKSRPKKGGDDATERRR